MGKKKNFYSVEFKINIIERYNNGDEGGVKSLSKKLGFRSPNMLTQWLKKYNEFGIAGLESKRGKTPSPMRGRPKKKYEIIEKLSSRYPVTLLLQVAEINRSGYYRWLNKRMVVSEKLKEDAQVIKFIEKLYSKHYGRYGVERMTVALSADYDLNINHKKVYRLMSQNGYLSVIKIKKDIGNLEILILRKMYWLGISVQVVHMTRW